MRWSERQQAMLREMGVRLWLPEGAAQSDAESADAAPTVDAAPAIDAAAPTVDAPQSVDSAPTVDASTAADALSTAGLDWPALTARAAACTACALSAGRTHPVFGAGPHEADWFIVGEAPDDDDDRAGAPFAGAAGRLLDNMLGALQLSRAAGPRASRAYLTQAVKCRPPDRRTPEPAELACCEPFLERQLALVRPRIVLALGRVAAQGLLRSTEPIGRLRGRVHRYRGVALVVTAAPSYLLRHPEDKAGAWEDLCLALQAVKSDVVKDSGSA